MSAIAKSRIDPELKRQAEAVLEEIGLKPRAALELFYKQIVKRRAIPFPVQADSPEDDILSPAARRNQIADEFLGVKTVPQAGEVWFVDLGMVSKPRYALVLAARTDARLALASVVLITKQFEDTPYEVKLPRVSWLQEQSYINVQSIQPVKYIEFIRKAPGKFDLRVINDIKAALQRWLKF